MAELTPMKRQYLEIHEQVPDCLLFFRLGDFYELFNEDALTASKELDLTLTTRDRGKPEEEQTPMCGVPFHSYEPYVARLISKGYKVAICEQLEDPADAAGLVDRGIIRIITPGTVTDSAMLNDDISNYICSIYYLEKNHASISFCDVSTGEFCVASFTSDADTHIINEIARFNPKEAILNKDAFSQEGILSILRHIDCSVEKQDSRFNTSNCQDIVQKQFDDIFSADEQCSVGALLSYLYETQKTDLSYIRSINRFGDGQYMEMDYSCRKSLELTENLRTGEKKGSLLWVLDRTKTPMGSRLLRSWIERPLLNPIAIKRRLDAVEELFTDNITRKELMLSLSNIGDIQRLIGRCVYGSANGRDLYALGSFLSYLPSIKNLLSSSKTAYLKEILSLDDLSDLKEILLAAIDDNPPFSVREGGIIRPGYNEELDQLRSLRDNGSDAIAALESEEREKTGIKKLKVGYNRVFGYYIEVPHSAGDVALPENYIRKQTLTSGERYFTPQLKELENALINARDRICDLEYQLFSEVREKVSYEVSRVQSSSDSIAELDCLCSLAEVAFRNNYCKPEIDLSKTLDIHNGRHPVVEQTQKDVLFVPNDTYLNGGDNRVAIITGPNMAGKSTYMRQTALIVLMAQIGSYVPAKSATIGIVDRVFTRIGASDDLSSGLSTFMVEMSEMANILKNASASSLLILDEIGRGTSTYDGMAIARAMLEYCADKKTLGARTMFATHYHELSVLEKTLDGVKNYNITAKKQNGTLVFLRKIVPGSADDSYGIEVAKLAGVPDSIIKKANQHLNELETGKNKKEERITVDASDQFTIYDMAGSAIIEELSKISVETITPIEAMNVLYKLKNKYTN